mmetsp:Transcript_14160/g.43372  ORF Transcript_14160/g.43372 Transcript_14160/m.43372 type:complete len:292 (-) Transcript_14160:81-956(-)
MSSVDAGVLMKKVSWASRAGCCCGWKSASKFQNEDSTNCCVGISSNPISRKVSRNIERTFNNGCKAPPGGGRPPASIFTCLKVESCHVPLTSISCDRSAIAFLPQFAYCDPAATLNDFIVARDTKPRFLRTVKSGSEGGLPVFTAFSCIWTTSEISLATRRTRFLAASFFLAPTASAAAAAAASACASGSFTTWSHLLWMALLRPTLAVGPTSLSRLSERIPPSAGTWAKTMASGLPSATMASPSFVNCSTCLESASVVIKSPAARLLQTPTSSVWAKPFLSANTCVSSMH